MKSKPLTDAAAQALTDFAALCASAGWAGAIQTVAGRAEGLAPKAKLAVAVGLAKAFKEDFPDKGVDTELLRGQLARKLIALIGQAGAEPGLDGVRLQIALARVAREYQDVIRFGEDMAQRFPAQADYAEQAIGWGLFSLKRPEEALAHFAKVPAEAHNSATKAILARLSAATSVDDARRAFEEAFKAADAGDQAKAQQKLSEAVEATHPELGKALPRTIAALAGAAAAAAGAADDGADRLVPLFCAGFRWSGASAIYDYFADFPQVGMFPRRPRFMQDSPAAMEDVADAMAQPGEMLVAAVRAFVVQQVVGVAARNASAPQALKVLENAILRQFDASTDLGGFDARLAAFVTIMLAEAGKAPKARVFPGEDFAAAVRSLSALAAADGERFMLFDSVIRAAGAKLLTQTPGGKMVAVFRDPRDMYVTHVQRGGWSRGVATYIRELRALFGDYDTAMKSEAVAAACKAVRFEEFIQDPAVREDMARWVGLDPAAARRAEIRFDPSKSAQNLGVHRGFADQAAIREIEAAFPERCARVAGKRSGKEIDVLSLSAMATKSQQLDRMGLAGLPGEPGWAKRREIAVNLFAEGAYDFIGLQHTYKGADEKLDAVGFFHRRLAERGLEYGIINRVSGENPKGGDSTPLYYRTDRWELDVADHGFQWFTVPPPPEGSKGGGGLLFVFGLFHERTDKGRTGRSVYVYNVRLRNRDNAGLDLYRARCFLEMSEHMKARAQQSAPVVMLGDTNTKVVEGPNDKVMRGLEVEIDGVSRRIALPLQDTLLAIDPKAHGQVRSQHDFVRAGDVAGSERNDRVLCSTDLKVVEAEVMTYNEDGQFPSYHYPVRAKLSFAK